MGKIAFVFPGQGVQAPGMGKDLYDNSAHAREIFDMAGRSVKELCFEGSSEQQNLTVNAQPCLFATDLACAYALCEKGVRADGAAGFSLGEIPAAAFAGLLSFEDALRLVTLRGQVMQACAEKHGGVMYAVLKLASPKVIEICGAIRGVFPANFNSAEQTVVSCAPESEDMLLEAVAKAGGRAVKLKVSGAFHSPFMEEAARSIRDHLAGVAFGEPRIPVYSNKTAEPFSVNAADLLAGQVCGPVYWQKTIENMADHGFDTFIETGPGTTLSGLIKKIRPGLRVLGVSDMASLEKTAAEVLSA